MPRPCTHAPKRIHQRPPGPRAVAGAVFAGVLALSGCAASHGATEVMGSATVAFDAGSEPPGDLPLRMWLTFDGLAPGELTPTTSIEESSEWGNDAQLLMPKPPSDWPAPSAVPHTPDGGMAVSFPGPCTADDPDCLRGILQVADAVELNPGPRDFSYGAEVRIDAGNLHGGSNVVQKGFSRGGAGQWKLQVDDKRGYPSCVLVVSGASEIVRVLADRTVADGQWHSVVCERAGVELTVSVDGVVAGSKATDTPLSITNAAPIRIGGKHVKSDADFLYGDVDEVFLRVAD